MESPLANSPYNTDQYRTEKPSVVKSYFYEFIQTLAVCLVIGMIIYWQIAQPHKVSGSSMVPTFHNGDYIITNKVLYKFVQPTRGDVVVLKNPKNESEDFIKRVMGLPGDKVKVQASHVYINDELLAEPYLKPTVLTRAGAFMHEGEEITVPPGQYLVFGDNRDNSSDSRQWGFVTKAEITGKVFLRYWPADVLGYNPGSATATPAPDAK